MGLKCFSIFQPYLKIRRKIYWSFCHPAGNLIPIQHSGKWYSVSICHHHRPLVIQLFGCNGICILKVCRIETVIIFFQEYIIVILAHNTGMTGIITQSYKIIIIPVKYSIILINLVLHRRQQKVLQCNFYPRRFRIALYLIEGTVHLPVIIFHITFIFLKFPKWKLHM